MFWVELIGALLTVWMLGFILTPLWQYGAKALQALPGARQTPEPSDYERDLHNNGIPRLAHKVDDWQCKNCGHDKFLGHNTDYPHERRCVRCRGVHTRHLVSADGDRCGPRFPTARWGEWKFDRIAENDKTKREDGTRRSPEEIPGIRVEKYTRNG